jgi:hypothetical protein
LRVESTSSRRADAIAAALLAALVTLFFADVLLGIHALHVADLAQYSYPQKKLLRDAVLSGEFPYWNRALSAGQPMAANPAHEVFYPLTWLILLPSFDLGFRLFVVGHLYIAALGMYALLRSLRLAPPAAFFGAASFALGGICLSLLRLLPFLASVVWVPLICLFTRRFLQHRRAGDFAWAAIFLGMQLLVGEPTTPLQTGLLLGLYALWGRRKVRALASIALIAVAAILLAAVAVVPAIDHAADSVRARGFPFAVVTDWSMPLARLSELVLPDVFEHDTLYPGRRIPFFVSIYAGLAIGVMAIAGLLRRERGAGLMIAALLSSVLLALGAHTPLWRLLYDAGIARSIRYPEKFIVFGVFAVIVFGAYVLDRVLRGDDRLRRTAIAVAIVVTILGAAVAEMLPAVLRGAFFIALLYSLPRLRREVWLTAMTLFVAADVGSLAPEVAPRIAGSYFREPPLLERQLPRDRESWRLFHLASWTRKTVGPYMRPQPDLAWVHRNAMYPMMPAQWGVQTVMEIDYDLTTLLPTADFMNAAAALSQRREDWLRIVASASNVRCVAVFIDPAEAFAPAKTDRRVLQPVRLFELPPAPRYSFAERVETLRDAAQLDGRTALIDGPSFQPAGGIVRVARETANTARIEVETSGRAFLVMSVTPHKYWTITVDGVEAPAVVTNIGYQGVVIPTAGRHVVEMRYRNPLIAFGGAISLCAFLVLMSRFLARSSTTRRLDDSTTGLVPLKSRR